MLLQYALMLLCSYAVILLHLQYALSEDLGLYGYILHIAYFILHTSYFILHTSNKAREELAGLEISFRKDDALDLNF